MDIEYPPRRRRRRLWPVLLIAFALLFTVSTTASYYVDALWFDSLGYGRVFWTQLNLQSVVFVAFFLVTFAVLYGGARLLEPPGFGERDAGVITINGRPVTVPVGPVLRAIAFIVSLLIAII